MSINSGEILFVKCVKDGIPNRDPLNESDARRLFGEDDGRISLSDVSIKRDVRDFVLARYPDGGKNQRNFVFCRQERTEDGKLLGRQKLAEGILDVVKRKASKNKRDDLMASAFDMRVFGAVYSVGKESFNQTGPVQFGWAHSLHPAETKYVQGTVVMPGKDIKVDDAGEQQGNKQGTIWTTYTLPFAVFAMPAVVNANIAEDTGMDKDDVDLLLEALWKGTQHRQARGRGMQQPLLMLHVEYKDPFFRIGYLEDFIAVKPGREAWTGGTPPTNLSEVELDASGLEEIIAKNKKKIAYVRYWVHPGLKISGSLPGEQNELD